MEKINVTVTGDTLTVREGIAPEIFQYEGYHYRAHSADQSDIGQTAAHCGPASAVGRDRHSRSAGA